jgi:hypothetical protein
MPWCYYPKDFPAYQVISNETTVFGERIRLVKTQATYMPNDIFNLTVDLIDETQQRLRIRIYDTDSARFEVPLPVPVIMNKVNRTDYETTIVEKPFAIVVTRKSNGVKM